MPKLPSSSITSRSVLLVEGNDEQGFFEALAKHMDLQIGRDIELKAVNGKGNYKDEFQAFLNDPGFSNVTSYGLIRDADDNAQHAFISMQDILKGAHQPCPVQRGEFIYSNGRKIKVGIFIMPSHGATKGMLEDLCLQAVQDHPIMPFVEEYITQVKHAMRDEAPKNESKARILTFLAGMKRSIPYLGVAAGKGYWCLDSPAFDEIRAFMRDLTQRDEE